MAVVVGALTLSACGGDASRTVRVGVIAPLSGALSGSGLGIRNGVALAVRQANRQHKVRGWKIVLAAEDDTAAPDVGANAATRLSDDTSVAAVVGTLNSNVTEKVAPILDSQHVVMISPANTDPALTRGSDSKHPARPFASYFRVVASDVAHGPFAADFAFRNAGKHTVVAVSDRTAYGQTLALGFKAHFEALGGKVPSVETVAPDDEDLSALLARIRRFRPDMIYFAGDYPAAARLTSQSHQQGITVPVMGGYGILDPAYITTAKEAAVGDLATSVGAATDALPGAKSFVAAYQAARYVDPYGDYGAYAYDAANAVIAALAKVLPGQRSITAEVRARVRQAVQDGTLDGVTGKVAFDGFGDRTTDILTVYRVEKDMSGNLAWKAVQTSQIEASTWE
jgi:branched-chain amino acid transport system substrate-binding protein